MADNLTREELNQMRDRYSDRVRIFTDHKNAMRLIGEIDRLQAIILKLDRMASQQLTHGADNVKPFAREVFNICEQVLKDTSNA